MCTHCLAFLAFVRTCMYRSLLEQRLPGQGLLWILCKFYYTRCRTLSLQPWLDSLQWFWHRLPEAKFRYECIAEWCPSVCACSYHTDSTVLIVVLHCLVVPSVDHPSSFVCSLAFQLHAYMLCEEWSFAFLLYSTVRVCSIIWTTMNQASLRMMTTWHIHNHRQQDKYSHACLHWTISARTGWDWLHWLTAQWVSDMKDAQSHACGCCWRVDLARRVSLAGFWTGVNGFEWIQMSLGGKLLLDNTQLAACYTYTIIITWNAFLAGHAGNTVPQTHCC